ncbi:MAG: M20 metallopeptidase family protein [Flammeovirgaceae bacterium]
MSLKEKIRELAKGNFETIRQNRRHIHANPELSFQEHQTAAYVAEQLKSYGLSPIEGIADTGLVAMIEGKNPSSKVIALRADMDALPIKEANDVPYKSKVDGVMHACGHDVHTSSLLGAAQILSQVTDEFEGTIKLIFQPGEEKVPGGASLMIKDGVLENPKPAKIIGQHVMPLIPAGKVGFREGMYMASADELYMTVRGKGGHAAVPEMFIDPVLITSHIIVALQQIVSRVSSPKIPSVLSFGKVVANGATNVIPNEVHVAGTFRTLNEKWRSEALAKAKKMAEMIAESMGGSCEFEVRRGYPFLTNEPELTRRMKTAAIEYLGDENVVDLDLWMAAEDFAYFSQEMDACFYRLGTRNEAKGIVSGVHTPTFDIDEDLSLPIGAGLMAWLAVSELNGI